MNISVTTDQRLRSIVLILLIILISLLIVGTAAFLLTMGGIMSGGMWRMLGVNGQVTNNLIASCTSMMRSFQKP